MHMHINRYKDVRRLYYRHLNGIIFVHDLTDRASYTALTKWAAEVASEGSFVAPSQEDQASRNLGGLPVPVLLVGTKADMLKDGGSASGTSSPSSSSSGWGSAARHLRRRSWNGKVGVSARLCTGTAAMLRVVQAQLAAATAESQACPRVAAAAHGAAGTSNRPGAAATSPGITCHQTKRAAA